MNAYSEKIKEGLSFNNFIWKRIYRIFPLMWGTLGLTVAIDIFYNLTHNFQFFFWGGNDSLLTLILNFIGVQDMFSIGQSWNYPAWSLTQFFICWIIFYWIIHLDKKEQMSVWLFMLMICLGICLQTTWHINIIFFNISISRGYVAFFTGCILWYIDNYCKCHNKSKLLIQISMVYVSLEFMVVTLLKLPTGPENPAYVLGVFAPIVIIAINEKHMNCLLSNGIFQYLGEISFSVYLCNYFVEVLVAGCNDAFSLNINASTPYFLIFYFALNIAIASLVHFSIEKWITNILKRLVIVK